MVGILVVVGMEGLAIARAVFERCVQEGEGYCCRRRNVDVDHQYEV